MSNNLRYNLIHALHGHNAHFHPLKLIEGITPDLTRQRCKNAFDSGWELILHMIKWQDGILEVIKGHKVKQKSMKTWTFLDFTTPERANALSGWFALLF